MLKDINIYLLMLINIYLIQLQEHLTGLPNEEREFSTSTRIIQSVANGSAVFTLVILA